MPAVAHPGNISYSLLQVEGDTVHQELKILINELVEALEMDSDADGLLSPDEPNTHRERLAAYLDGKISVSVNETSLTLILDSVALREEEVTDLGTSTLLHATVRFQHSGPIDNLLMRCRILDDLDERHDNFAKITIGAVTRPFLFTPRNEFH